MPVHGIEYGKRVIFRAQVWGLVICELRNGELVKCELGCELGL